MEDDTKYTAGTPASNKQLATVPIGSQGIVLRDFSEAARFAEMIWKARMAPKDIDTPEKILVCMQMGMEVGLPPMAALNGICVINGRPSIWGDNLPGLVEGKGVMEEMEEWYELNGVRIDRAPSKPSSGLSALCLVHRKGKARPIIREFTWDMAVQAQLDKKAGPWTQYPLRMLQMRARSWAIRDQFPDVLRGIGVAEEIMDIGQPTLPEAKPVESLLPPPKPGAPPTEVLTPQGEPAPGTTDKEAKMTPYERSIARRNAKAAAKDQPKTVDAEVVTPSIAQNEPEKAPLSATAERQPAGEKFPPPPLRGEIPRQAAHAGSDVIPFHLDPSPVDRAQDPEPFI